MMSAEHRAAVAALREAGLSIEALSLESAEGDGVQGAIEEAERELSRRAGVVSHDVRALTMASDAIERLWLAQHGLLGLLALRALAGEA